MSFACDPGEVLLRSVHRSPAGQTAWLLPKDGQCKRAWDWNADTLCSSAVIKGNAGNNRQIFTSTQRKKTVTGWEAAQRSGLLQGALLFWLEVCLVHILIWWRQCLPHYQLLVSLRIHKVVCWMFYIVPDFQQSLVNVDTFPIHQELQVGNLWAVKLLLQRLCDSHVVIDI